MTAPSPILACAACPIRHRAVCAECDTEELATLERIKSYRTFTEGQTIARAGEPFTHFSSVVTGAASMSKTLEDGRRQTVGLLLPSDYIGRPGRRTSPYDIVAVADTRLCRFESRPFERMVAEHPHISGRLLEMTLDELDAAREWAVVLGRLTAREKLAAFLVSLARRRAADADRRLSGRVEVDLPLTREAIADHLGLTIETTSRQVTALRKDGLIEMPSLRRVVIPDFDRLVLEAGDEDVSALA